MSEDDVKTESKKRGWALWELQELVEDLKEADLRALFAIIGGKLGKREITPEQQAKMQAARKQSRIEGNIPPGRISPAEGGRIL